MSRIDNKQIVYIKSSDRDSGTPGDFTYTFNIDQNIYDRVTLLQCGIPKSYYNVQQGYNTFTLSEGNTATTITIAPGNYTRTNFASALGTLLSGSSPNGIKYAISIPNALTSVDTGKYTYTISNNTANKIVSFIFTGTANMNELMGFSSNSTNTFTSSTLVSTTVINMQPYNCIQIRTDMISDPNADSVLHSLYMNIGSTSFSNVEFLCPDIEAYSHYLASSVGTIRIYLTDEDKIPIDLNGVEWQLTLCLWKKNNALQSLSAFMKLLVSSFDFSGSQ